MLDEYVELPRDDTQHALATRAAAMIAFNE
jgi:hypothetical protein